MNYNRTINKYEFIDHRYNNNNNDNNNNNRNITNIPIISI